MTETSPDGVAANEHQVVLDRITLRYIGENEDGTPIHELNASDVADALEGLVALNADFGKAGAFGDGPPPELMVRPAKEGSFILEVVQLAVDNPGTAAAVAAAGGFPSLGSVLWWVTRSHRADVKDFSHLDNGNVKVVWQDDTAEEIPPAVWKELNKGKRRRKRDVRKILAPLSDQRVTAVQVRDEDGSSTPEPSDDDVQPAPEEFTLERSDYHLARPEDEISEISDIFETEAQMGAVDFDSADKWRVKTPNATRSATVEDTAFLAKIDGGLAVSKDDIFNLRIREDTVVKNGRTTRSWTVLEVKGHRKGSGNDDT